MTLARSLERDWSGSAEEGGQQGKREMWRGGDEGLAADFDYVMFGKVSAVRGSVQTRCFRSCGGKGGREYGLRDEAEGWFYECGSRSAGSGICYYRFGLCDLAESSWRIAFRSGAGIHISWPNEAGHLISRMGLPKQTTSPRWGQRHRMALLEGRSLGSPRSFTSSVFRAKGRMEGLW